MAPSRRISRELGPISILLYDALYVCLSMYLIRSCLCVYMGLPHCVFLLSISVSPFSLSLSCIFCINLSLPSSPLSFLLSPFSLNLSFSCFLDTWPESVLVFVTVCPFLSSLSLSVPLWCLVSILFTFLPPAHVFLSPCLPVVAELAFLPLPSTG